MNFHPALLLLVFPIGVAIGCACDFIMWLRRPYAVEHEPFPEIDSSLIPLKDKD